MRFLQPEAGILICGLCCLVATSCASTGYQYTGGGAIGIPTLVDARDQAALHVAGDTKDPRLIAQGNLTYPTWPLLQHVCGTVFIRATIDTDGRPQNARVDSQTFNKKYVADENTGKLYPVAQFFDQPAIDFVMSSRYEPSTVKGVPEKLPVIIPLYFGHAPGAACPLP